MTGSAFEAMDVVLGLLLGGNDGKRSDTVRSCTFYSASRREEKGEGLGEERARDRTPQGGYRILSFGIGGVFRSVFSNSFSDLVF